MILKDKDILQKLAEVLEAVRIANPLVHCITNRVTINDCANALLAIGASPVMADGHDAGEMAHHANALVLNIGSVRDGDLEAIHGAAQAAASRKIPIVFDPVGVGSTSSRGKLAQELLEKYPISIIRGNWSEIRAVCEGKSGTRGVDSGSGDAISAKQFVEWAKKIGTVLAVTGKEDWISDGRQLVRISNGDQRLQQITGTGCMSTALCGSAATEDVFWGAVLGVFLISLGGELGAKTLSLSEGSGTLRVRLMDQLNLMMPKTILENGRISHEIF